jgi:hypothetical protein
VGTLIVELVVIVWTIARLRSSWRGGWGLALLAMLTIVPFSVHEQLSRIAASGLATAPLIRQIVGADGVVAMQGAVDNRPEAFYYAGVRTNYFKGNFLPGFVEPGTWVVMDQFEYKKWLATPGVRLERDQFLCKWGPSIYHIAWYAKR